MKKLFHNRYFYYDCNKLRIYFNMNKKIFSFFIFFLLAGCITQRENQPSQPIIGQHEPDTVLQEAERWLGQATMNTADVINGIISNQGPPDAYIMGEEAAASLGAGVRYGVGDIYLKDGTSQEIYWRGPSIGVDVGINAGRVFILIYGANNVTQLYQRFGGIEGSLFIVGGISHAYHQNGDITVVPVRLGVGLRSGANIGFLEFLPEPSRNPVF